MLFNSLIFVAFFIVVYSAYLMLGRRYKWQNALLLVGSYVFYGYWDWRFLSLIFISTAVDFVVGGRLFLTDEPRTRKILLALSVACNLTILGFFKYFGFFAESIAAALRLAGLPASQVTLNIVLPVGISFYTFQTMSYTIDIYRRKIGPTDSFLDFALFVAFFPQLVAGPIERAANLLPQIQSPRRISLEAAHAALFLLIWGYFKKVVIADNVGVISDQIFGDYLQYHGLDILLGIVAFSIQIYCDFSGYSDIARGLAKLMGFELMVNFKLPYFALNPRDFWRRWHVSLSSWLRDYLYIPLGGNRKGRLATYRILALTMLLGGLWHGASWNFVIWGGFHGLILILYRLFENRGKQRLEFSSGSYLRLGIISKMMLMLVVTLVGWVIFRSSSVHQMLYMLSSVGFQLSSDSIRLAAKLLFFAWPLIVVQVLQHVTRDLLVITRLKPWFCVILYSYAFVWILTFGVRESVEFIYFQF